MKLVAELADQNVTGNHPLAAEFLDPAPLRIRIATVATGALSLFMCHCRYLVAKCLSF
jgi:hypothetical protein